MDWWGLRTILADIKFKNWEFDITNGNPLAFRVRFAAPDSYDPDGEPTTQWGRRWIVEDDDSPDKVVKTAFSAIKMAMEHEIREEFKYKGKRVFSPHKAVVK